MISIPFTPYHLGPSGLFGILFLKWVDLPTLLIASVIIDIEPILIIVFNLPYPLHGFFHSFLGGFLVATVLILVMKFVRDYFTPIMEVLQVKQEVKLRCIIIGAFLGTFSHIIMDAPIYNNMNPFFPFHGNPFLIDSAFANLYISIMCIYCFLGFLLVYLIKLSIQLTNLKKLKN